MSNTSSNRNLENKTPQRPHIKESGSISKEDARVSRFAIFHKKIQNNRRRNIWAKRRCETTDNRMKYTIEDVKECIFSLNSAKLSERKKAIIFLRKILSEQEGPKINGIDLLPKLLNDSKLVESLDKNLRCQESLQIQTEVVQCISNIAALSYCKEMMKFSPVLILFLSNYHLYMGRKALAEQCFFALGNLASESDAVRVDLLKQGILKPLGDNLYRNCTHLELCVWVISHLTRVKDKSLYKDFFESKINSKGKQEKSIVGKLIFFLLEYTSEMLQSVLSSKKKEIFLHILWALSMLCSVPNFNVLAPLIDVTKKEKDIFSCVMVLVRKYCNDKEIVVPCLRILGNILRGPDEITNELFWKYEFSLPIVDFLLEKIQDGSFDNDLLVIKESAYLLSLIAAGNKKSIEVLVKKNMVEIMCKIFDGSAYVMKREIVVTFINLCSDGSMMGFVMLKNEGLKKFIEFVSIGSGNLNEKLKVLEFFEFLFRVYEAREMSKGDNWNNEGNLKTVMSCFEKYGGLKILEELSIHKNQHVEQASRALLKRFSNEEEEEDCNEMKDDEMRFGSQNTFIF